MTNRLYDHKGNRLYLKAARRVKFLCRVKFLWQDKREKETARNHQQEMAAKEKAQREKAEQLLAEAQASFATVRGSWFAVLWT